MQVPPEAELTEVLDRIAEAIATLYTRRADDPPLAEGVEPEALAALFDEPLPLTGRPALAVVEDVRQRILPSSLNLSNPMTFGLMVPHPLPLPAALDSLVSALNQNLGCAWRTAPAAIQVELQTLRWLMELAGLPDGSEGHFTTGGTVSNVTALRLALQHRHPNFRSGGARSLPRQPVVYVSDQGHFSIDRAAQLVGLGDDHVRKIASDAERSLRVEALAAAVEEDRRRGLEPLAVVGTAGTTGSGAVDPLPALADLCREEGLWLHVDAAYGGALLFSERYRALLDGIERADSISVDPHKWLFMPLSLGVLLTRHAGLLGRTFGQETDYLGARHVAASAAAPSGFFDLSLYTSRRFNGLKLWAALQHLGRQGFAEILDRQVDLARATAERLERIDGVELAHPPRLNILCFRAPGEDQTAAREAIERDAGCWLSEVTLAGRTFVRLNLLHYDLAEEHADRLVRAVSKLAGAAAG